MVFVFLEKGTAFRLGKILSWNRPVWLQLVLDGEGYCNTLKIEGHVCWPPQKKKLNEWVASKYLFVGFYFNNISKLRVACFR